ncbi:MAG: 4-hydroxythreonine-4-phosphate dehydrogenase PdxA [Planctomycetes bacterium]|jgi:4-hydroxythreonine-4-phosphate dehydrogenase|nr:4-hydroxythreonine-4-phosphate dehydrogenase PdxA [Planctomycetota bacterium]
MKPKIGLTMGDPAGIGPEVVLKALCDPETVRRADLCVIGHEGTFFEYSKRLGISPIFREHRPPSEWTWRKVPFLVSVGEEEVPLKPGEASAVGGRLSFEAFAKACELAKSGVLDAVVTAPINKTSWKLAGVEYVGHTDYLSRAAGRKALMMMVGGRLRVTLVTVHVPLREAIESLTKERIVETVEATNSALIGMFGIDRPRIAVAGLNPHSGEEGLLGREEEAIIAPAVREAVARGIHAEGPMVPDVVFRLGSAGRYDAVVAMYHDQGLIPVKIIAFEEVVNITAGIPIVRTSPGHGTAFDIAGKGLAKPDGFAAAIRMAAAIAYKPEGKS